MRLYLKPELYNSICFDENPVLQKYRDYITFLENGLGFTKNGYNRLNAIAIRDKLLEITNSENETDEMLRSMKIEIYN